MKKLSIDEMKDVKGSNFVDFLGCHGDVCCIRVSFMGYEGRRCGSLEWYLQ